MKFFIKDDSRYREAAKRMKRPGEVLKISMPIEFEKRKYREIIYNKSFLGKPKKEINGIAFITEDGTTITDENIVKNLVEMAYRSEIYFDDSSKSTFGGFIESDDKMREREGEYARIIPCLELLRNEGVNGCDEVIKVLNELPEFKKQNKETLKAYIKKVEEYEKLGNIVFTRDILEDVRDYYIDIFLKNFNNVKLMSTGAEYYEEIKKRLFKEKKNLNAMSGGLKKEFLRLENFIDYVTNLIGIYKPVINMTEKEYLSYFQNIENGNLEKRMLVIRK